MDIYGFYTGGIVDAYKFLGAHIHGSSTVFRTFAPNAEHVELLYGDVTMPMHKVLDGNFYEAVVEEAAPGKAYEYRIHSKNAGFTDHCDPYGFGMELPPKHKSIVRNLEAYSFNDTRWMASRTDMMDRPLNIYELHLGSWRLKGDGTYYKYNEIAEPLAEYLKEMGYNYVELMPISEHPVIESWGYQNTGFFSPTSRYGTAGELMELIDILHQNQIGVILDFVPVHFAIDDYALAKYDGTALYEYPNHDIGISEWGSYNFMHSRGEVRSFLQSCANYWLSEFHFDGLRMDAISRIIYWHGDEKRGVNGNAVDFIKVMNREIKKNNPGCILIAEDSTNYPGVTTPVDMGGLGFDYKWDMGWMNDSLNYFRSAPEYRIRDYHKLTFSMMYYWNENYLLPLSHDEVVHGKATIVQKMNGQYGDKFPQARAFYMYMYAHPGKKLNFMGNEIGQLREWDEKREQDWALKAYPMHDSFSAFMKDLSEIYLKNPAFSQWDYKEDGFRWIDCHQEERCIYAIERSSKKNKIGAVFNFSDREQSYQLSIPEAKVLEIILSSDEEKYSGKGQWIGKRIMLENGKSDLHLPPFSGLYFEIK